MVDLGVHLHDRLPHSINRLPVLIVSRNLSLPCGSVSVTLFVAIAVLLNQPVPKFLGIVCHSFCGSLGVGGATQPLPVRGFGFTSMRRQSD